MAELSLQEAAKYNKRRTAADHALIYAMATALGTVRYVEQSGSSYMRGASCLDADGIQRMFLAAGRAYIHHPESEALLTAGGIRVTHGATDDQRVVLFSNAGGSNEVSRSSRNDAARPTCPTCWTELPATGICDNC